MPGNFKDKSVIWHQIFDVFSVRKSQSMVILNSPDPKQSLVAWESKSYYVDR